MICSSCPVPSVATHSACVSPRVNRAEPWARRQDADLGDDRADRLGVAAVDAQPGVQDGVADDVGLKLLEHAFGLVGVQAFRGQRRGGGLLGGADLLVAGGLLLLLVGFGDRRTGERVDPPLQRRDLRGGFRQVPRLLRGVLRQFDDRLDHRLEAGMAELQRAEHDLLGQLVRLGLHHQHAPRQCRRPPGRAGSPSSGRASGSARRRRRYSRRARRPPGRRTGCRTASARRSSRPAPRCPGHSPCRATARWRRPAPRCGSPRGTAGGSGGRSGG